MFSTIFMQILNMNYATCFVIVAVLLIRLILKRTPKVFSYLLWAVVLFRLLCPISFESAFSVIPSTRIIQQEVIEQSTFSIDSGITAIDTTVNDYFKRHYFDGVSAVEGTMSNMAATAAIIWLVGIAVLLLYSGVSLIKLHRKLVGAVKLRDNIYLADHIASPFVMGLFHPKIYLPSALSEQERDYIILHEQYHIHRLDHIVKILAFLTLCVHWFNPLVWLAFVLSGKDMEMSCDEAVMKKMGGDIRANYSASLLSLATGKKIIAGTPLAFGEGNTKERIKNIMNYKKSAFWIIILAIIVCVVAAICLLSNPKGNDSGTTNVSNSTLSSSPSPSQNVSPSTSEAPTPKGETKRYTYQNLEIELTNVKSDRTETMLAEGFDEWKYTVITYYPGAKLTVINADMSDPTYAADGKAHPEWAILINQDERINIVDNIQPLTVTADMGGIFDPESSLYVFKFEAYSE